MEANKILSADLLDIVFEGRNKAYGAYDLRKTYQQRLKRSLLIMFSFLLLVVGANFLFGFIKPSKPGGIEVGDYILTKVEPPPRPEPPPPPVTPPPPKPPEQFKMKIFTNPLIVKEDPPEETRPPINSELDNVRIGTANTDGKDYDGTVVGPPGNDKGLLNGTKKTEEDPIFTKVEIESQYPGGPQKWMRYLEKEFGNPGTYPDDAVEKGVEGSVKVMFVVDTDGTVTNVTAVLGPIELQPAAIKVIRASGKWLPAIQNGRKVKSYKVQVITFKIGE